MWTRKWKNWTSLASKNGLSANLWGDKQWWCNQIWKELGPSKKEIISIILNMACHALSLMMAQLVSMVESKTTLDIPSRKECNVGSWLQMIYEYQMDGLKLQKGEEIRKLLWRCSCNTKKKKKNLPPSQFHSPIGRTPAGNPLARESWKCSLQISCRPALNTKARAEDLLQNNWQSDPWPLWVLYLVILAIADTKLSQCAMHLKTKHTEHEDKSWYFESKT